MPAQRYLVTARKYRPKLFGELVAQEHVTETLENALRLDRLAHSYLFSGPRGVGKTTAARILAKAINCTTPLDERDGAEPCRTCDSCRSFEDGRSLDIIEIDAASNNKVDDIRELRESVRIPPQGSRKKVYIVDEVHMLSTQAFNALLKTLEEPPPHVLFIFATTEPNKVLPTILSRCQRFDFRRIPVPDIVARLREICENEGIHADDASLLLLARKGDGALRDALSAFDQAVSLCGTDLHYSELAQAMGVVEVDLFFEVTDYVREHDAAGMLQFVERVVRAGYDLQEFLVGLTEHLRNVLVALTMDDASLIEATDAVRQRYASTAAHFAEADLLRLLTIVDGAQENVKTSSQPRLKLELALLKMASLANAADLRTVMSQLDRLEQMARDGQLPDTLPHPDAGAPPSADTTSDGEQDAPASAVPDVERASSDDAPAPSRPESSPTASMPEQEREDELNAEAAPDYAPPSASNETVAEPEPSPPEATTADQDASASGDDDDEEDGLPVGAPDPAPGPPPAGAQTDEPEQRSAYSDIFGKPALRKRRSDTGGDGATGRHSGDGAIAAAAPNVADAPAAVSGAVEQVQRVWTECVQAVMDARKPVGSCLQDAIVSDVRGDQLVLEVPSSFHRDQLRGGSDVVIEHVRRASQVDISRLDVLVTREHPTAERETATAAGDPQEMLQQVRESHPPIDALCEQFGVEIVW